MALQPGTRLGSFEVLGPLGAGGMGEVYRARDTRLGRDVAIKVFPESFARDPARAARFEREARLLAAINHPAIGAIYGAEEFGSLRCIIMELVPGETLTERIARGPIPLEEACDLARQIAEALEAAHDKGVIHRDLKPSNIKVTPEGKIKVLDLGLAKVMELPSGEDLSQSPTLVDDQTRPGVILGTVEFMSPEQARGKPVDKRTDIWAFGCVFFEMLSGRRAFTGETSTDVFAAILSAEPDWSLLPAATPPRLRELLSRCLQKDANKRLRDIGDARLEIDRALARTDEEPAVAVTFRQKRRFFQYSVLALLLLAGIWVGVRAARPRFAGRPEPKYLVVLPFRDLSNQPQGQLLGDGLVATVSARLKQVPGIQVVTPADAIAASDKDKDPFRIAKSLGANLVFRGAIQREGDRIRITYSVLKAPEGVQVAADDVTGSAGEIFALQDRLTEKIATELNLRAGSRLTPAPTGLETASQQERYIQALGHLQRSYMPASIDEAIRLLEALAGERPEAALVQAGLGRAYLDKFNLTRDKSWAVKASDAVARARRLAPQLPEVESTLGELLVRTGKPQDAVAAFRRALALQPNSFDVLLGLAKSYDATGLDARNAEETYQRAIRLQPSYWAGYSKLGGFYYQHGRFSRAVEMFSKVVQLSPDNARSYSNLGGAEFGRGRFSEALQAFEQSIRIQPTDLAYNNVGTLQYYLGHYGEAAAAYEKAIALLPGHYELWANLGDAYRVIKEEGKAQEAYSRAISLADEELRTNPLDSHVHSYLGLCLAKTGNPREAEKHVRASFSAGPNNPEFLFNAAIVANEARRADEAVTWLRRAATAGFNLAVIRSEPMLANLRGRSDFQEILRVPKGNP